MKNITVLCQLMTLLLFVNIVTSREWKNSAALDNNFLVLWTPNEKDIVFEVQVKTQGYVGLGFTSDERHTADMVIGWVDNNGQVHLQVSNLIINHLIYM